MEFLLNLNSWFKSLPASGKLSLFFIVVATVIAGFLVSSHYEHSGYQYLFTNLSDTDANAIAEKLQASGVKAEIRGDSVLVPGNKVLELRNMLASEGLPRGGGVGFEIFDKKNFGETAFQQRVNYVRAMQGELARTVSAIDGIEKARVHLVIPEDSLFAEDKKDPSASVSISLFKGRRLSDAQISGIVHLMKTSIEGLTEAHINVIDQNGNILFKGTGDSGGLSGQNLDLQRSTEARLEKSVVQMLEKVVGVGSVSATVSAQMNFNQVEKMIEAIDPESRVAMSEQIVSDTSTGASGGAGGTPGAASNIPGGAGTSGGSSRSESSKRSETTTTYAVTKTTQKVLEPVGVIQKLSVAVLVDGTYTKAEDGTETYAPRSAEEVTKLVNLVRSSVGFNEARGDEVRVENIQFRRNDATDAGQDSFVADTNSSRWMMFLIDNMKIVGVVLILGVIMLLMMKLINSYAPPVNVAYANIIGQSAARVAEALPAAANVNIIQRDSPEARAAAENIAKQLPEAQKKSSINIVESSQSITVEAPVTSEEKLRLQAAKLQVEHIIGNDVNDAIQVIRSWLAEG